jgi:hypothetical protein
MLTGCMGYGNTAEQLRTDDQQEEEILSLAQEWKKSNHFQQFLRQELARARTEAEKEVVRAELAVVNRRLALLKDRLNEIIGLAERSPAAGQEGQTLTLQ